MIETITVDTSVLFKCNVANMSAERASATLMERRILLLRRVQRRELTILVSARLLVEYQEKCEPAKNEYARAFLELATRADGTNVIFNWKKPWSGGERAKASNCRFPNEDQHVLRTAIRPEPTAIVTEEERMLKSHPCVYKAFSVKVLKP